MSYNGGVRIANLNRSSSTQTQSGQKSEENGKSTPPVANNGVISRPDRCLTEYLTQLIRDQTTLQQYGHLSVTFNHIDRLLNEEIEKVRSQLLETISDHLPELKLPSPVGDAVTITRKIFFPKDEYPDFNFTGRILGPRGATIKRLEKEIGPSCTLAIRGKGSDPKREATQPIKEDQHVLVTIKDTPNRCPLILDYAQKKIKPFLVPVDEEKDELKKSQMIELALLKGNYRDNANNQQRMMEQFSRLMVSQMSVMNPPLSPSNMLGFPAFPSGGYSVPSSPSGPANASNAFPFAGLPMGFPTSGR